MLQGPGSVVRFTATVVLLLLLRPPGVHAETGRQYFDVNAGAAVFRVRVNDKVLSEWTAADRLPTRRLDESSSSRQIVRGVALRTGDRIEIEVVPEGSETAALDYIEVRPAETYGPSNNVSGTPRTPIPLAR